MYLNICMSGHVLDYHLTDLTAEFFRGRLVKHRVFRVDFKNFDT